MCGIVSIVTSVMNHVIKALLNKYIPIVDFQHCNNMYFKEKRIYRDNAWEYFFEQPCLYALSDIEKYKDYNVVISKDDHVAGTDYDFYVSDIPVSSEYKDDKIDKIREYYRKYIRFSADMKQYAEERYAEITKGTKGEEILGILLRGTDYTERKSPGEYIQPEIHKVIQHAKSIMRQYPNIKKIYVATEDASVYEQFKGEFSDILLDNPQYMYHQTPEEKKMLLGEISVNRKDHHYHLAKEYLASLYLLSKLNYFISGRCNGSALVWLMAKQLRYFYIYNIGTYKLYPCSFLKKIFSIQKSQDRKHKILSVLGIKIKFRA